MKDPDQVSTVPSDLVVGCQVDKGAASYNRDSDREND